MAQVYITEDVLRSIQKEVVNIVKSSRNYSEIIEKVGISAINISPIPPDTKPTTIEIPIFETKIKEQSAYSNVDQYSGCPEQPISATSSMPGPNVMSAHDDNGNLISLSELSTSECMIVAMANGIIKQLIKDNKLVFNQNNNRRFNWFIQEILNETIVFNINKDYPFYYYKYNIDENLNVLSKVSSYFDKLYLEKYTKINIDTNNVQVNNIKACNILAYNKLNRYRYSIYDYYITNNELWIKLKTPYEENKTIIEVTFDITIQYLFDEIVV